MHKAESFPQIEVKLHQKDGGEQISTSQKKNHSLHTIQTEKEKLHDRHQLRCWSRKFCRSQIVPLNNNVWKIIMPEYYIHIRHWISKLNAEKAIIYI